MTEILPSNLVSEEDWIYFRENEEKLVSKKFQRRPQKIDSTLITGLFNEGSTCYLNSVIQCLAANSKFRDAMFGSQVAEKESSIENALKVCFAKHTLSQQSAISANDLIKSFGWSKEQMFQQHDAHELYSLLMGALDQVANHWQGDEYDMLECMTCGHKQENKNAFNCISVSIPPNDSTTTPSPLIELLQKSLEVEMLDDENRWICGGCQQPCPARRQHQYRTLPSSLTLQLKRFSYDKSKQRRVKLSHPVIIPEICDFAEVLGVPSTNGQQKRYELTGVVIHHGTAMGGHYQAIVRSAGRDGVRRWYQCNDEHVTIVTDEEMTQLLNPSINSESADVTVRKTVAENAYLLLYSLVNADETSTTQSSAIVLSAELQTMVDVDNTAFTTLLRLQEIRNQLVSCQVVLNLSSSDKDALKGNGLPPSLSLFVPRDVTIATIRSHILQQFINKNAVSKDLKNSGNDRCRIRKGSLHAVTSNNTNRKGAQITAGETYGGRDQETLEQCGFGLQEILFLDVRLDEDAAVFTERHPDDCLVEYRLWQGPTSSLPTVDSPDSSAGSNAITWTTIIVPGRKQATIASLRSTMATAMATANTAEVALIAFPASPSQPVKLLVDDENQLDGSKIIVVLPPYDPNEVLSALDTIRKQITISVNDPRAASSGEVVYEHLIVINNTQALSDLKQLIITSLSLSSDFTFHLRRGATAPQFKNESKALHELSIIDQSIIHVQPGPGCGIGEHMIRFELMPLLSTTAAAVPTATTDQDKANASATSTPVVGNKQSFKLLGELAVSEKLSVLQLKRLLFNQWSSFLSNKEIAEAGLVPQSEHHIRLRDLKAGAAKPSSALRDDRILSRCLLGLADGRRIAVQVLTEPEIIKADDLLIAVQVASYDKKLLYEADDICVPRGCTLEALYDLLSKQYSALCEDVENDSTASGKSWLLEMAKAFTSGPPLTLKTALKLKWDECLVSSNTADAAAAVSTESLKDTVDRPPLNLRDGSLLVVRGKADWRRAQARVKAKREAEGNATAEGGAAAVAAGAGTGTAAVRAKSRYGARRPLGNSSSANNIRAMAAEPVLKITGKEEASSSYPPAAVGSSVQSDNQGEQLPPSPQKD